MTSALQSTFTVNSSSLPMSPLKKSGDAISDHREMNEYCSFGESGHGCGRPMPLAAPM